MKKNKKIEIKQEPVKKTLDEIWGIPDTKYLQKSDAEYKSYLWQMNEADLRNHCMDLRMPYYPDRSLNIENLINEFNKHKFEKRVFPSAN